MSTITEYGNELGSDLLQAHELLKGGLKHAVKELRRSAKEAGEKVDSAEIARLKAIESISDEAIEDVGEKLGFINYLEAEGDIDTLEKFDRLTGPLSEALTEARKTLAGIEEIGEDLHRSVGRDLNKAWHDLHIQLEMVRLHLALDELETDTSLEDIRADLATAFAEAARKAPQDWEQSRSLLKRAFQDLGDLATTTGTFLGVLFDGTQEVHE